MATMNSVIAEVDRLKPNIYTEEDKCKWLNTVEGLASREVMQIEIPEYMIPDDADTPLLIPHPFDDMYVLYVGAMIDFYNREYDGYNNMTAMFKERYDQYKEWYNRNNTSGKARNFRRVMG